MVVHYKKQEVHTMATKTANVTARIQPNIKEQAEESRREDSRSTAL